MQAHKVVSREKWFETQKAFLAREKELTHLRDKLNEERLALPWVKVDKTYSFETPSGRKTLAELFGGRSQLLVYHFMLAPGWEAGCTGCSFMADHFDGTLPHLNNHDVSFVAVSRAPLAEIEAYKKRMDWHFPWVSSGGTDFNYDFGVSFTPEDLKSGEATYNFGTIPSEALGEEQPGFSAFQLAENGEVFHTYSSFSRGLEEVLGTYMLLDRAPKGRNETGTMSWVKRHDEYGVAPAADD